MADVFLSYARSNAAMAKRIADALRARSFTVWFDEGLPAHRAYSEVIEEQLDAASAVLVLWSAEAVQSQWVRSEANRARETRRLVQARVDDARLPMPFDQIQCADLQNWRGQDSPGWQSVIAGLEALKGGFSTTIAAKPRSARSRRQFLIASGAVAAVAGAGGFAYWRKTAEPPLSPEAQLALQKGLDALQNNDAFDNTSAAPAAQAIAFLTDATRLAPNSASAWGGLAMAYAVRKKASPPEERPGLDSRSRSAAQRALEINPLELRAIGAQRMLEPVYRNWAAADAGNRAALKKQPRIPLLLFLVADTLASVGRCREAADFARRFDRQKWLIAGADRKVIVTLWSAGDLAGADNALRLAVERWPQHPLIWRTRLAYLTFSGKLAEAERVLKDPTERPSEVDPALDSAARQTIGALAGRSTVQKAVQVNLSYLQSNPAAVFGVAHALAFLSARSELTEVLNGYFFGEGDWSRIAPIGGDEDRQTLFLFQPPMEKTWAFPEFGRLLQRIGLEDYWRKTGTTPDFRRR